MKDKTTNKTEVIENPTAAQRKFFAEVEAAKEAAQRRIAEHGPDPVFQTRRWREKTSFPVGVLLDWELASREFWPRIRARRCW